MGLSSVVWMDEASCRDAPAWVNFVPILELGEDPGPALAYCASCTVSAQCLLWALTRNEELGIWGGMTDAERRLQQTAEPLHPCDICNAQTCPEPNTNCDACQFTVAVAFAS